MAPTDALQPADAVTRTTAFAPADAVEPAGAGIRGTVRDAAGEGLPRAAVTLISVTGDQLGRSTAHVDGSYDLDVPGPGSYGLIVAAEGHQPQAATVVVREDVLGYDIRLAASNGPAGLVRCPDGGPVSGARVVVTDAGGEVLATATTGERGGFDFEELTSGAATVTVSAPGFRPAARTVETGERAGNRLEFDLVATARVQGTVRSAANGGPLPDALVTLLDSAGEVVATSTTGDDGAYAFTDLDAGEYSVIASGYPPVANVLHTAGPDAAEFDIELSHDLP
ncbi:carboxypeptidase-like regulatory domain-containing protein [Streptomyces sp. YIM 130001]|uniref:MSCRAMM family protein n=1 Tax=Streptomyces sp. YIM 130001 TaxID=2259644 RepID=UPI001F09A1A9|nr:carboxypeptidase-like regulatory domain-containing protein [Streptomyces sp. YIM 130001]